MVNLPPRTAFLRSALAADDHLVVLRPREDHRPWVELDDPPHEEFWLST